MPALTKDEQKLISNGLEALAKSAERQVNNNANGELIQDAWRSTKNNVDLLKAKITNAKTITVE